MKRCAQEVMEYMHAINNGGVLSKPTVKVKVKPLKAKGQMWFYLDKDEREALENISMSIPRNTWTSSASSISNWFEAAFVASEAFRYSTVSNFPRDFLRNVFNRREEQTTVTDDKAIAALPIQGCILNPQGENIPAATGMPIML